MEKYTIFLVSVAIFALASAKLGTSARLSDDVIKHKKWMARYGRVYENKAEKEARFNIFRENMNFINDVNKNRNLTFKLGVNNFADLTFEEFKNKYLSRFPKSSSYPDYSSTKSFKYENMNVADLPASIDWRAMGAVTPVKNQGACGTCWAFSTIAAIEGISQIKTSNLISLSEQQLVDCMPHADPCSGGYPQSAFTYVAQAGGIASESDYPYIQENGPQMEGCMSVPPSAQISTYENVPQYDEVALMKAVAYQPVSVLFKVGPIFQHYTGGIITSSGCGPDTNHAITMVGYGTDENGNKYWLAKNSWSANWGDNGYLQIQRDSGEIDICGITEGSSYPV